MQSREIQVAISQADDLQESKKNTKPQKLYQVFVALYKSELAGLFALQIFINCVGGFASGYHRSDDQVWPRYAVSA